MQSPEMIKIPIDQLCPGMFVGNVFNERGVLLYRADTLIADYSQIEALRRQGVYEVSISNRQEEDGAPAKPQLSSISEEKKTQLTLLDKGVFKEENVRFALEIRSYTINSVREVMASAKSGRLFSISSVTKCVESIMEIMLDEPELLISLCRLKTKNAMIYEHSVNVAVLMVGFCAALGFTRDRIIEAGTGGMLHDIGKMKLPEELLMKRGEFTRNEYGLFKKHTEMGLEIVDRNRKKPSQPIRDIISQHHERLNGSGYPARLRGGEINEIAFICAIADMYDSLTTQRHYQKNYIPQEALALIFQGADDEYPRNLVEHFTKLLGIYPVGSFVRLDSGEMGVVIKNNRQKLLTPVVKVLFDEHGNRLTTPYIKDLSAEEIRHEDQGIRIVNSIDPLNYNVSVEEIIG